LDCPTFQNIELFSNLTVLDNLMLAATTTNHTECCPRSPGSAEPPIELVTGEASRTSSISRAGAVARFPVDIALRRQKRVELGRALAMQPKLLLPNEPVAG